MPVNDALGPDAFRRRRRRRRALRDRRCTNCSASSAIRSRRSNAALAERSRLRHGACAEGLSLRPVHRPRGDAGGEGCHAAAVRPAGDASASAAMSRRSAISPQDAGTRRAVCWRTSPIDEPRDALALQAGHQIDFFTGNSRMLRDRIAARHAVMGSAACRAITRRSPCRLSASRRWATMPAPKRWAASAIGIEPRDGWAQHAVAHVMEMQCRQRDGISWMRDNTDAWTKESFFQVHNWWHLALFHYELGEIDEALALFDGPIYGVHSTLALNMLDASALLWRLHLARRRCRRPLGGPCRQLGAQGQGRQLRLQRRACDDGLRRRRARRARHGCCSKRRREAMARQTATMPASPAMSAIR